MSKARDIADLDFNSVDLDGGTIDGATISTSDITVTSGKTLDVSAGTLTLANNQISGDKIEGGTVAAMTITSLSGTLQTAAQPNITSLGTVDITGVVTANAGVVVDQLTIDGGNITSSSGGMRISGADDITVDAVGDVILSCDGDQVKFDDGTSTRFTFNLDSTPTMGMGTLTLFENEIDVSSGNLTLDVAGDIILDADGADVRFKDAGTEFYKIRNESGVVQLVSTVSDSDLHIVGNDGGSAITALAFDMSAAGRATFNNNVVVTDNNSLIAGSGDDLQIFYNGTNGEIDVSSGNLTLDVAGDIILDAGGGDIQFKEGGTLIGSIGVDNGNNLTISGSASNHSGLEFGTSAIFPQRDETNSNNTVDLGEATIQFKDIFLGGEVKAGTATFTPSSGETVVINRDGAGPYFGVSSNHSFRLITNNATRLIISNSGNISTNPPAGNHFVINENGVDSDFRVQSDNSTHALFVNGENGNVLIGDATTQVTSKLVVSGNASSDIATFMYDGAAGTYFDIDCNAANGVVNLRADARSGDFPPLIFTVGNAERLRININARLAVNGSATTNGHGNFVGEVGANSKAIMFEHTTGGGETGSITTGSSSAAYNTSSDYRLKENIDYTWDATTRLKQLKPARFNFIIDDTNTLVDGFIAHEAQAVVPEAVHGTHNEVDADGNAVMQGIDQSKLVPLLVKTIQELEARITALES